MIEIFDYTSLQTYPVQTLQLAPSRSLIEFEITSIKHTATNRAQLIMPIPSEMNSHKSPVFATKSKITTQVPRT